ncbi:hypothetical protein PGTUg99_035921 [Puccinia graminis f. sp. tritici]|uniref:Uncharacterized protein n=1 Tax=Puccinia graminis f. sp. tritici TaxID=56615 RepID=A0A5B0QV97_PUCGR|nr:hypothetical protein PGTUg99_035921 [Puccinia graminis f. sp. tritici]
MWRTKPRPSPPHSAGRYHYYRIDNQTNRRTVTIDYRRQTPHHQSIDLQTPYTASSLVIETRQSEESTSASEARHVEGCPTYFAAVSKRSLSLLARRRGHTIPKKERERARRHQAPSPHLQRRSGSSVRETGGPQQSQTVPKGPPGPGTAPASVLKADAPRSHHGSSVMGDGVGTSAPCNAHHRTSLSPVARRNNLATMGTPRIRNLKLHVPSGDQLRAASLNTVLANTPKIYQRVR